MFMCMYSGQGYTKSGRIKKVTQKCIMLSAEWINIEKKYCFGLSSMTQKFTFISHMLPFDLNTFLA